MNNIEKIKFGDQPFDLIPDGVKLGETGGTVTFQKGSASFDQIKALLKANDSSLCNLEILFLITTQLMGVISQKIY